MSWSLPPLLTHRHCTSITHHTYVTPMSHLCHTYVTSMSHICHTYVTHHAQVLYDLGVVSTKEPFGRLVSQGMILGEVEFTYYTKTGVCWPCACACAVRGACCVLCVVCCVLCVAGAMRPLCWLGWLNAS
jgi:hypothetical protein